jgi:hypothetical protein
VTARVFGECIELTAAAKRACNDVVGRTWDVLFMGASAMRAAAGRSCVAFEVYVVRRRMRPTLTRLVASIGPGDDGAPVITIMFPGED